MIKPVVINDKKEVIEGSILFSKSNSFIEALNNREDDITLCVLKADLKIFLRVINIDKLDIECLPELAIMTDSFIRCMEINKVFCPAGNALYKKSEKKNGVVRYCNKHQCRICEKKCFNVKGAIPYKEVDFSKRSRLKMKK